MIANWQKRLSEPLSVPMRRRLEVALAVVVTMAVVVVLSRAIRPDPSKLAEKSRVIPATAYTPERRELPYLRPASAPGPLVPPEFAAAVARGDLETMEKLYVPETPLTSLLFPAAQSGSKETVLWLLDHGADIYSYEEAADDPILVADAFPEVVDALLARRNREPSLAVAARAGAINNVTRLLAKKVDVDPNLGPSPLVEALRSTIATTENRQRIVEKLLAAGASPNRPGLDTAEETGGSSVILPLTVAVRACTPANGSFFHNPCVDLIKVLVARGARANGDALTAAASFDEMETDAILDATLAARIEPGATAFALTQIGQDTPPRVIAKILAKGVDWGWHEGEEDAALPLVAVIQRNDRATARLFLEAGAPPDRHFKNGKSAIGEAFDSLAYNSSEDPDRIVELLLEHRADVNRRLPDGRTLLFAAAEVGNVRIIDALLDRGARINDIVLDDTALDAAEQHAQTPAARVLHSRGGRRARRNSPPPWEGH